MENYLWFTHAIQSRGSGGSNLYGKQIHNRNELHKILAHHFNEHDDIKPHYAHKIYTPNEVYYGANPKICLTPEYRKAAQARRIVNKNGKCGGC